MNPWFQRAVFMTSAAELRGTPPDSGFEVAFAGRSNAGKSSAINAICHQHRLARTSKTPGRTQHLNFFQLDDERRLVDLPGYGFARVSVAMKTRWQAVMARYLRERQSLTALVLVMDIRHPLTDFDRQMLDWADARALPLLLLLTKADKLGRGAIEQTLSQVRRAVAGRRAPIAITAFSATSRLGLPAVQQQLADWLACPTATAAEPPPADPAPADQSTANQSTANQPSPDPPTPDQPTPGQPTGTA